MVEYYRKNLIISANFTISIWKKLIILVILGLLYVSYVDADTRCCYSTTYNALPFPNSYRLNLTASHVDSKKSKNQYVAAVSFPQGYTVIGQPFSPFSYVRCTQKPDSTILQFECESRDRALLFIAFDLTILPPPSENTTITASTVFIFSDKCQNLGFCTDLAEKRDSETSDKISLGPLGTWPKYAVIIGGVVLGITFLVTCYFVYRRSRPDESHRDRSVTPGNDYNDKNNRLFSPNSLLRSGGDNDNNSRSDEPPKNTLIQFGSAPERSKSVHNKSLKSSASTKKKRENYDGQVAIDMSDNDNYVERSKSYHRKNNYNNNNAKRTSGYSTSDLSKTISNNDYSDREWGGGSSLSDGNKNKNNNDDFYSSKKHSSTSSLSRVKSSRLSENDRRSSNSNNKSKRRSEGVDDDHDNRRIDRTTSSSNSRSRKRSSSPPLKSKSDLQKGSSTRSRKPDRDSNKYSENNLDRKKSNKHKDLGSTDDTESISSSDIPLGDKLPLATLATKLPSSSRSNGNEDDDTPLGRINSFNAGKGPLLNYELDNSYDSVLGEVLNIIDNQDKISEDDFPIGKSLSKEK